MNENKKIVDMDNLPEVKVGKENFLGEIVKTGLYNGSVTLEDLGYNPSKNGSFAVYSADINGQESYFVRALDLASSETVPGKIVIEMDNVPYSKIDEITKFCINASKDKENFTKSMLIEKLKQIDKENAGKTRTN